MKILDRDIRRGFVKLAVEDNDDLWYLSHIIDIGDKVEGSTFRKIKIGDSDDRNSKVIKKKVFMKITVEKIEFHKYSDALRVSGKIAEGPEDIPIGSYHTFNFETGSVFNLEKEQFLDFQAEKLKEASMPRKKGVMICAFDREEAIFALMKNYGYEIVNEIKGNVQKKDSPEKVTGSFYQEIIALLKEYSERYNLSKIVVGSPSFWKEYLLKEIEDDKLKSKLVSANCNSAGKNAIDELIRRPEVMTALSEDRVIKETRMVDMLFQEIQKGGKAAYGIKEASETVSMGAVSDLIVSDGLIHKLRQEEKYAELDSVMKLAASMQAKIHIISSEHDAGKKLDGLGGIGAILRYKT